jgi:hypothetical protein
MKVVEGVHVGGGGLADDPGEDVVALMAAGRGATGGLVVGVGEEVLFSSSSSSSSSDVSFIGGIGFFIRKTDTQGEKVTTRLR